MKHSLTKDPIASFTRPPHAPEPVAKALDRFDSTATRWAAAKEELREQREELARAEADDLREVADLLAEGKPAPKDTTRRQREVRTRIGRLEQEHKALGVALDEVGNELVAEVAAVRPEWIDALEQAEAEVSARYAAALSEATDALRDLTAARAAAGWLRRFKANEARLGLVAGFQGGRAWVEHRTPGPLRGRHDVAELLKIAGLAVEEPAPEPRPRAAGRSSGKTQAVIA